MSKGKFSKKAAFLAKEKKGKATVARSQAKTDVLAKALKRDRVPRLLFSMDATASREEAWNIAKEITGAMFEAIPGKLDVGLAYHSGGFLQEITPFTSKEAGFKRKLQSVSCRAGGTAFNPILDKAVNIPHLKAIIYIGDCFEENEDYAYFLANQLRLKGIRLFIFHDTSSEKQGYDINTAREVFHELARRSKGAVFPFDVNSPEVVKALLEAISIYAGRGIKALKASKSKSASLLLAAMEE